VSDAPLPLPAFTSWPTFPFEGDLRVKSLADPVDEEPPRHGEDPSECSACRAPDSAYIWISERWRVRSLDRPTGLPMVLILESRSHLDMGDLTNLLAAELGVLTVRLERAIRSLDGVARVHVNRWGDGSAHLHVWFLARPAGRLQLRGTFLSLWDDILPRIPETQWRENLALVAAWLADFGGEALAEPPHIDWQSPAELNIPNSTEVDDPEPVTASDEPHDAGETGGMGSSVVAAETSELTRELNVPAPAGRDGVTTVAIPRETGGVVSRGTDRTVNLANVGGGETVRIPTARTTGGETVNLADVASSSTVRFAAAEDAAESAAGTGTESGARSSAGFTGNGTADARGDVTDAAGTGNPQPTGTAAQTAPQTGAHPDSGSASQDASPTMRFGASGVTGSGTQTMIFPTGDAMAAARAESRPAASDARAESRSGSRPAASDARAESRSEPRSDARTEAENDRTRNEKNAGEDPRRPAASKS
jgi:hypothetical protein